MRCDELVRRILEETQSDTYKLYIGGEDNFRYKIYPEYKANRSDKTKPEYLQDVRAFLVSEWNAEIVNGMEADDALGIAQDRWGHFQNTENGPDFDTIICSIDKDLLQVPGWHYNFVKQERVFIDELTGLKHFYQQLILGDQSDNIPGYDGLMRPKVPKFLAPTIESIWAADDERNMYNIVLRMYSGDKERLLRNGRLLWIRRTVEDDWRLPVSDSDQDTHEERN